MTASHEIPELFDLAVADHQAGRIETARSRYEQILCIMPSHADALHLLGVVAHQRGDTVTALRYIAQAIEIDATRASYYCNYGNVLRSSGRPSDAEAAFRRAIELQPALAVAHNNLASLLMERGALQEAVVSYEEAVRLNPHAAAFHLNLAAVLRATGDLERQARSLENATDAEPGNADAWIQCGTAHAERGLIAESVRCFARAIDIAPRSPWLQKAMSESLARGGSVEQAIALFRHAADAAPDCAELRCNLGAALNDAGHTGQAAAELRRAIELDAHLPDAHYNLGIVLLRLGQLADSLASFQRAIDLAPDRAEAHVNAALVLWRMSALEDAKAACERGLSLDPRIPEGYIILGNVLKDLGAVGEALVHYRRALELRPDDLAAHANLIFSLHYLAETTPEEVGAEITLWNERQTAGIKAITPRPIRSRRDGRISIGYVSANLRTHPGGFFLGAVLAAHDRSAFHVSCYVDSPEEDEHSRRLAAAVDRWCPIAAATDEALAARIREDEIDILVDMNRFSGSCRLRAFARRPAPVQVTWMGGPVTTTGLAAMDYVLTDAVHTPPEYSGKFVETVVRLNNAYAAYQPPGYAPPVGPLPALRNGFMTFGSFNYVAKLGPDVFRLWAGILSALPHSRILLQSKGFANDGSREWIYETFSNHAIDRSRVTLHAGVNHRDLLALYGQVDIALDPFPYSGGITTCEALWMGVPVVTMPGPVVPVRHSVSHLLNAGRADWIAAGPGEYQMCAIALASDVPALGAIRAGLRERVAASALCDAAAFTRRLEDIYRDMWRRYATQKGLPS